MLRRFAAAGHKTRGKAVLFLSNILIQMRNLVQAGSMADQDIQKRREESRRTGVLYFLLGCANVPAGIYAALQGHGYTYMTAVVLFGFALFTVWLIRHRRRNVQDARAGYALFIFLPVLMFGLPLYFCSLLFLVDTAVGWELVRQNSSFIKWLLQIRLIAASAPLGIGADSNALDLFLVYRQAGLVYLVTMMLYVTVLCAVVQLLFFAKLITEEHVAIYTTTKVKPLYALGFWLLVGLSCVYYIIHPTYFSSGPTSKETMRHGAYALMPGFLGFCLLSLAGYLRYLYRRGNK